MADNSLLVTDQCGREVNIPYPPVRIVSVVPSQTELLFDLGLKKRIKGITWFCVHPKNEVNSIPGVGGTKKLKTDKIRELAPDLIIANKEENEKDQIESLAETLPVWVSNVYDLPSALEMITEVGRITVTQGTAASLTRQIQNGFDQLPSVPERNRKSVLYLIWRKPFMTAGGDTFINEMLNRAGLNNAAEHLSRYPQLTEDDIRELNPDYIWLSSEPFPFKEKHIPEIEKILPRTNIQLVDGEMFSWYGSRLLKAPEYIRSIFNK